MPNTFQPSQAGLHALLRDVNGPVAQHVDRLVDRMVTEAIVDCPVAPPSEFPPGRWAHVPLHQTIERTRIYPTADGVAAKFGSDAPHAAAVHNGTRPHPIRARFARTLRFRKGGVVLFPTQVSHPGTRANPWLRRAADRVLRG